MNARVKKGLIVAGVVTGVLGAVAYTVGKYGVGSLAQLASLVVVFWVACSCVKSWL